MAFTAGGRKTLTPHKSVVIFDDIQFFPRARQAIKHLVKDGLTYLPVYLLPFIADWDGEH